MQTFPMSLTPLPPLNALRAFEATARCLSVTEAAAELHVTPPAVSHQIKALEEYIGFPLFQRLHKGITLTDKGSAYFFRIARQLASVSRATEEIRESGGQPGLTLGVPPHFFVGWMASRLTKLIRENLLSNARFVDTVRKIDFDSEGIDAQITWGSAGWSGMVRELLFDDELCIVCSREFLDRYGPLSSLHELAVVPLIHTDSRPIAWDRVLSAADVERPKTAKNLYFLRPLPAVEAARNGFGVAIASRICVADLVASGALVIPFRPKIRTATKLSYSLVRPTHAINDVRLDGLRDSLRSELALAIDPPAPGRSSRRRRS